MVKLPEDSSPNKNADDTKPQKENEDDGGDNKDVKDSRQNKNVKNTEPRETHEDPVDDNNDVEDSRQNEDEDGVLAARMNNLDLEADSLAEGIGQLLIRGIFEIAKLVGNIIMDNLYECVTQDGSSQLINISQEFQDDILLQDGVYVIIFITTFTDGSKVYSIERIIENRVVRALMNTEDWPNLDQFLVVSD